MHSPWCLPAHVQTASIELCTPGGRPAVTLWQVFHDPAAVRMGEYRPDRRAGRACPVHHLLLKHYLTSYLPTSLGSVSTQRAPPRKRMTWLPGPFQVFFPAQGSSRQVTPRSAPPNLFPPTWSPAYGGMGVAPAGDDGWRLRPNNICSSNSR